VVHLLRIFLFAVALTLAPGAAVAREPRPIDIVFDIDWTLFSRIPDDAVHVDPKEIIVVEGLRYRMADGVVESLNLLRRFPNVRISVFSGGAASRNEELLKAIVLDAVSGLTARDIMSQVRSFDDLEDLAPNSAKGEVKFRDRYRKNLRNFFKDLGRTILIDDMTEFAADGQKANLLWTGPTFDFFETFGESKGVLNPVERKMTLPTDPLAWKLDRLRIPVLTAMLESAIREDAEISDHSKSFVDRVGEKARVSRENWMESCFSRFPSLRWVLCGPLLRNIRLHR